MSATPATRRAAMPAQLVGGAPASHGEMGTPRMAVPRARAKQAPPRNGSVLIDTEGRYGTSPAMHFKPLLRAMQRVLKSGDTAVVLSGAKLNVVILALQKAIWVEEEVIPRDLYAFSALNRRGVSQAERLRTLATRMLGRPERGRGSRSAVYPEQRIVEEYLALTGQGEGDTSFYSSRGYCGLSREHDDFEPIRLPLTRAEAMRAIQRIHGFASRRAAQQFIHAAMRKLPKSPRPPVTDP